MHARRFTPLLGAVLLALVCLPAVLSRPLTEEGQLSARANPDFPDPTIDAFYKQTSDLAGAQNGQVLRRRSFPSVYQSGDLAGAYQLFYKTSDTHLKPQGTVAAIHVPAEPVSPPRILSVQYYQDSVSVNCAPSWAAVKDSGSGTAIETALDPGTFTNWALKQGWYVVSADFEGPDALFIAGYQAGHSVLDGVRALINDQKLPKNTPVAMFGYSGGAHATVWAGTLHSQYAPELNIVGSAHGGTPVDPKLVLLGVNGGMFSGFGAVGLIGLMMTYPELKDYVYSIATAEGKSKLDEFRKPNYCFAGVAVGSAFLDVFRLTTSAKPLDHPTAVKALRAESLLADYASFEVPVPKFPRYIYHAILDEIVPYEPEKRYVQQQCARGANIQFKSFVVGGHMTSSAFGTLPAMRFLEQAFAGTTPKVACGTVNTGLLGFLKKREIADDAVRQRAEAGRIRAKSFSAKGHHRSDARKRRG